MLCLKCSFFLFLEIILQKILKNDKRNSHRSTFIDFKHIFMTFAWYGHLKFPRMGLDEKSVLWSVILISWGFALFEYIFQVPANRIGFRKWRSFLPCFS